MKKSDLTLEKIKKEISKIKRDEKKILENQEKLLKGQEKIFEEEVKVENLEREELEREDSITMDEKTTIKKLKEIEEKISQDSKRILTNITKKDLFKGFIGATIGVLSHFAFVKGFELSLKLSIFQITTLYLIAYIFLLIILYYTGFRNIQKIIILKFMPYRATLLFFVSILTIALINVFFGFIDLNSTFLDVYKIIGANIVLAVIGAGAADLIGRE